MCELSRAYCTLRQDVYGIFIWKKLLNRKRMCVLYTFSVVACTFSRNRNVEKNQKEMWDMKGNSNCSLTHSSRLRYELFAWLRCMMMSIFCVVCVRHNDNYL